MALERGARLGAYEIIAELGAGGMGIVYRARDTKLDRNVALKILPEAFVNDVERLARFQREAKVLASLNHPNIAQIHGLEESGETPALVLEYVEGPTLADRIARGPIPIDEALPIARQIAEALEAAHEQGIIHRDLKPANVKVKSDGTVKVLDFGLAKALEGDVSGDPSQSPTMTAAATRAGVIMGTAAYMAPEQAKGRPAAPAAEPNPYGRPPGASCSIETGISCWLFRCSSNQRFPPVGLEYCLKGRTSWRASIALLTTMSPRTASGSS